MMKRIIAWILCLVLALCACAFAEEAGTAAVTAQDLSGVWNLEYVTADGYMVTTKAYGMMVTLNLYEDGAADMDFDGDVLDGMAWRVEDGKAWITGYNPEGDVELLLKDGVLEITDSIGSMFFTRPAAEGEAAE